MKVTLVIPTGFLAEWSDVAWVQAHGREGSFGILPRRLDLVSPLVPGILGVKEETASEADYAAVDGGLLVKTGDEVLVATPRAIRGRSLDRLRETVTEEFQVLDEKEREARVAMAGLEARFVRRFVEQRRAARRGS